MPPCRNDVPTLLYLHFHVLVNVKTELAHFNRTCIQGLHDRSITIHPLQARKRERESDYERLGREGSRASRTCLREKQSPPAVSAPEPIFRDQECSESGTARRIFARHSIIPRGIIRTSVMIFVDEPIEGKPQAISEVATCQCPPSPNERHRHTP